MYICIFYIHNTYIYICFIYINFNCCSITVVPHFSPLLSSAPSPTHSHNQSPSLSSPMSPLFVFLDLLLPLLHLYPSPPPLWLLSISCWFPRLWFYFAHLFVLFIRFHLKVRSYSICLSLPCLFHLA